MARTVIQVQADLTTVNSALQDLIAGKRLTQLRLGSGDFQRHYNYQEITYDVLKAEQADLTQELAALQSTPQMQFRTMSNLPLNVTKFRS
jgi:hypothetical protein